MKAPLQQLLRRRFGLRTLREGQAAVIERVMAGQDTLAVMPTGAGKSLCWQLPAVALGWRVLVISPLLALMKDQCQRLRALGVEAQALHSAMPRTLQAEVLASWRCGQCPVLFTTPERAVGELADPAADGVNAGVGGSAADRRVDLLVIDEAHCLSQWGLDFRTDFLAIGALRERLGQPPVLALTATATTAVAEEICAVLGMPPSAVLRSDVRRDNLYYAVEHLTDEAARIERLVALFRHAHAQCTDGGSGLVYLSTVKAARQVHAALCAADLPALIYHGKLPSQARKTAQDAFMSDRPTWMVATNAFGMGIDKADIRFVIHAQLPASLEAYAQETGRAGRAGQPARCTLLYVRSDRAVQRFFLAGVRWQSESLRATIARLLGSAARSTTWMRRLGTVFSRRRADRDDGLARMVAYAETGRCRWQMLLQHFDEVAAGQRCGHCDVCERLTLHEQQRSAQSEALNGRARSVSATAAGKPALAAGDQVEVARFGGGEVVATEADAVTVRFPDGSERSFVPAFVVPTHREAKRHAKL